MSYDLRVLLPSEHRVCRWRSCWERSGLGAERSASTLILHRRARGADSTAAIVNDPVEIDDEDLDWLAPQVPSARWLIEINIPASATSGDRRRVRRFANALAREGQGVVYDPQVERVTWPRSARKPTSQRPGLRTGRVLEIAWLTARRLNSDDARGLLELLDRRVPEALPRRFGDTEPLPFALDREGQGRFARGWDGEAIWSWSSNSPALGGHVKLRRNLKEKREAALAKPSGRRWALGIPPAGDVDELHLSFDADVLRDDPRRSDAILALVAPIATLTHAFYAAGWVNLNIEIARNQTLFDGPASRTWRILDQIWLGLPPLRAWLSWYGAPYRELVRDAVVPAGATAAGDGLLLRLGQAPRADPELEGEFPQLPPDLVCVPTRDPATKAARIPNLNACA